MGEMGVTIFNYFKKWHAIYYNGMCEAEAKSKLKRDKQKKREGNKQGFPMAGDQLLAEREKNWGLWNINQTLHLVGNHMAEQHVHRANLLIASNRVQLIPLAASSTGLPV